MEQLLPFANIADYILHCTQINLTQINSFELGQVLMEIIFCLRDDHARST